MARSFTGIAGDQIVIANESNFDWDITQPMSVALMLRKPTSTAGNCMVGKADATNFVGWAFNWQGTGGPTFDMHFVDIPNSQEIRVFAGDAVFALGQWVHLCATYDGSKVAAGVKLYCNGFPVPTGGGTNPNVDTWTNGSMLNNQAVTIGGFTADSEFFPGELCDVGIWTSVLSQADVFKLAAGYPPQSVSFSSIVSAWSLRQPGTTELDLARGLNTGTINGTTLVASPPIGYAFPTTAVVIDSGVRANENPINPAQYARGPVLFGATNDLTIGTNKIVPETTASANDIRTDKGGINAETFVTMTTKGSGLGAVFLRVVQNGSGTSDGYALVADTSGDAWNLSRMDNCSTTNLNPVTPTVVLADGDAIGLRLVDMRLTAWYKASGGSWVPQGAASDTTYSASGAPGLFLDQTMAANDYGFGPFVAPPTAVEWMFTA